MQEEPKAMASLWPDTEKGRIKFPQPLPIQGAHVTWKEAIIHLWFLWTCSVCLYHLPWLLRNAHAQLEPDREIAPSFSNWKFTEYKVSLHDGLTFCGELSADEKENQSPSCQKRAGGWKTYQWDLTVKSLQTQLGDFPGLMFLGLQGDETPTKDPVNRFFKKL